MALTFISSTPADVPENEALDAYSRAVTSVAERLSPSVANLRVSRRVRGGRRLDGGGSSVVITPDGYMLTSAHVVARTDGKGRASFVDGRELEFEVVGSDPLSDLAVLRADGRDLHHRGARRRRSVARGPARGRDREPARLHRFGDRRASCRRSDGPCPPARARTSASSTTSSRRTPRSTPGTPVERSPTAAAASSGSTRPSRESGSALPCRSTGRPGGSSRP